MKRSTITTLLSLTLLAAAPLVAQTTYVFTGHIPTRAEGWAYPTTMAALPEGSAFTVSLTIDQTIAPYIYGPNGCQAYFGGAASIAVNFANGFAGHVEGLDLGLQGNNAEASVYDGGSAIWSFSPLDGFSVSNKSYGSPYELFQFQDFDANFSGSPSLANWRFDPFIGKYAYFNLHFVNGIDTGYFQGWLTGVTTSAVPEPSTYAAIAGGLALITAGFVRTRGKRGLRSSPAAA